MAFSDRSLCIAARGCWQCCFFTGILCLLISWLFMPPPLCAEETAMVLLMANDSQSQLLSDISSELNSLGLVTRRIDWTDEPVTQDLFWKLAKTNGAVALIRVPKRGGFIEAWVGDIESARVVYRTTAEDRDDKSLPFEPAVATAELLRASLMEVRPRQESKPDPEPARSKPAESQKSPESPASSESAAISQTNAPQPQIEKKAPAVTFMQLRVELGGGVAASDFTHPPTANISLGLQWNVLKPVGVVLFGHSPITPIRVTQPAGTIVHRHGLMALGVRLTSPIVARRLKNWIGGGAGLIVTRVKGYATSGFESNADTDTLGLVYLRTGLTAALSEQFGITVGALVGRSLPGTQVFILEDSVLKWGHVILCGFLALEFSLLPQKNMKRETIMKGHSAALTVGH